MESDRSPKTVSKVRDNKTPQAGKIPNRLISEKSPYLLQHAYNPVDWYPWGEEAFSKASREDKPIFLSIGYSTCHWCHVMEKESFEDPEVARLMNQAFISIKVDREERPDLDHLYMTASQMLTGAGGWPLNLLMTPDKRPFFAGTYIPKMASFGRAGMMDLIPKVMEVWTGRREEVFRSAEQVVNALQVGEQRTAGEDPDASLLHRAYGELTRRFDKVHGGFGDAPKFPTPHHLSFLLRYWDRFKTPDARDMAEKTLEAMARGGIWDHVGYGFHRYCTDRQWLVPHFEKMLYDQALLALAYSEAQEVTGKASYGQIVREIFTYVLRDLTSPEGGFYSAEDADSEGVEGKFYLWEEEEVRALIPEEDADLFVRAYTIRKEGNFAQEATHRQTGANILYRANDLTDLAKALGMDEDELEIRLRATRARLLEVRQSRIRPHRDDKILTDWNGLMIAALSLGARVQKEAGYVVEAATRATEFILERLRTPQGRLLHCFRQGEASIAAILDDYAFFIWGLIELHEATLDPAYLEWAVNLNEEMLTRFRDPREGALFFAPDDALDLIVRKKEFYDGALPSGNSVALLNLLRLSRLAGESRLKERAWDIARVFSGVAQQLPSAYTQFLIGLDYALRP